MKENYRSLAQKARHIRKKYKLSPVEAACISLWLAGVKTDRLEKLADLMEDERRRRREEKQREK